jgi:hypothetical protein
MQQEPLKRHLTYTSLQGATTQKTANFMCKLIQERRTESACFVTKIFMRVVQIDFVKNFAEL